MPYLLYGRALSTIHSSGQYSFRSLLHLEKMAERIEAEKIMVMYS